MVTIGSHDLTLQEVVRVARDHEEVSLSAEGLAAMQKSRRYLEEIREAGKPVYGITTGFGIFADRRIPGDDSAILSRNLILSHAVGTGPALPDEVVRAAMLVRANTLAKGFSGIRPEIVELLLKMLNQDVTPIVPSQGSLGSSGDLLPLSHMALVFTRDDLDCEEDSGWAKYRGKTWTGKAAMEAAGLPRVKLWAKEGLALNNGATFSAAIAALAIEDAAYLLECANGALALSLEAVQGCSAAFDARIHEARGQIGQKWVAEQVRHLTQGSSLVNISGRVQDAYSLRCGPQVQGPAFDTLEFVRGVVQREINAATDNPLIFGSDEVLSGGNFHGEPVGMTMDFLSIAMSEIAAISERRTFRLLDGKLNDGLPAMLVDTPEAAGLNSGLMMPQYTAAALVLENQTLAGPDSVRSLPTSGEQEDHNANSMTAARHVRQIIENVETVLAIELYTAARALHLRLRMKPESQPGKGTKAIFQRIQQEVPYRAGDAWWGPEIEKVKGLIARKELPAAGSFDR